MYAYCVCSHLSSPVLVVGDESVINLTLSLRHRHLLHRLQLLRQVSKNIRLQASQEKWFHDSLRVSYSVFFIGCPEKITK